MAMSQHLKGQLMIEKTVPLIPTPLQLRAAYEIINDKRAAMGFRRMGTGLGMVEIYQAMINAAPTEKGASK
jgi:hypothetical protein